MRCPHFAVRLLIEAILSPPSWECFVRIVLQTLAHKALMSTYNRGDAQEQQLRHLILLRDSLYTSLSEEMDASQGEAFPAMNNRWKDGTKTEGGRKRRADSSFDMLLNPNETEVTAPRHHVH